MGVLANAVGTTTLTTTHTPPPSTPPSRTTQARDPRATAPETGGNCSLTATMTCAEQQENNKLKVDMLFCCGNVVRRDNGAEEEVISDAFGAAQTHQLAFDAAMFPMLHPRGLGGYQRGDSLCTMLQQRMQQLFSPFTLQKEYVLVMSQVSRISKRQPLWCISNPVGSTASQSQYYQCWPRA